MVTSLSDSWNSLYPSLIRMHERLEELGFVNIDGFVSYPEMEEGNV